jgi:hypothetical protein
VPARRALKIKRPVDIGKIIAGLQQNIQTRSAPATDRLYGQTVKIPRFIFFWVVSGRPDLELCLRLSRHTPQNSKSLIWNFNSHKPPNSESQSFAPWALNLEPRTPSLPQSVIVGEVVWVLGGGVRWELSTLPVHVRHLCDAQLKVKGSRFYNLGYEDRGVRLGFRV